MSPGFEAPDSRWRYRGGSIARIFSRELDGCGSGLKNVSHLFGCDHLAPSLSHDLEGVVVGLEAVMDQAEEGASGGCWREGPGDGGVEAWACAIFFKATLPEE